MNQLHNTVIMHRYAIEPVRLILFKTFLHRPTTEEAVEGWERDRERVRESVSYSGPAPAPPLQQRGTPSPPCDTLSIGDSSVWRAVFVLYCYW